MTRRLRRAGFPWRLLVHEYDRGPGQAHDVFSDQRDIDRHEAVREKLGKAAEDTSVTFLPGTEFDELVVGKWLHIEQMDTGRWWMNIGGVTLWVTADRDGNPKQVTVFSPGYYADPVDGCEYDGAVKP